MVLRTIQEVNMDNLQYIFMYVAFQCLLNFDLILGTTKRNVSCALNHGIHITNIYEHRRQSITNILFPNLGPPLGKGYQPTFGFEAYWPGGDWVYGKESNKTTVTKKGLMCGRPCTRLYQEYGSICARDRKYKYKTFENYCQLYNEDCSLRSDWLIVYRGECQGEAKTYPTKRWQILSRAVSYISIFQHKHPTTQLNVKNWMTTTRKIVLPV